MRLKRGKLSFLPLVLALAAGGIAAPAFAGGPYHDRVYADSFGNLVIHSRSGYKRIVVGAGHLAKELAGYEQLEGGDDVVYLDDDDDVDARLLEAARAAQGPKLHVRPRGWRTARSARRLPFGIPGRARRGFAPPGTALIWSSFYGQ